MDYTKNNIMANFIEKLNIYVAFLDKKVEEIEALYNARSFLISNYKQSPNILESITSIPLDKLYELLSIFENTPRYSKQEIEKVINFCKGCESQPKFKEYERYKDMYSILEYINQLFIRQVFSNQNEENIQRVTDAKNIAKKFHDLQSFIKGELPNYVLEPLETYYFENVNLSQEEWLKVYFYLTMIQIEYYKRKEYELKEEITAKEEQRRNAKATALEKKILKSISEEDALVLKPNSDSVVPEPEEVEEDIPELVVPEQPVIQGRKLSSSEEIKQKLAILQEKYKAYKYLGRITPTMRESFEGNLDPKKIDESIEYVKSAYKTTDYYKFLFLCFYKKYSTILNDINATYPENFDEYVKMILEDMDQALYFISILEKELALENKELEEANESEISQTQEAKKPYKLIFYEANTSSEFEKNIKGMSQEKLNDLAILLSRLEEGRFGTDKPLKKSVKVGFRLLRGRHVFVTFRNLSKNHIIIFTSGILEELHNNSVNTRLNTYDINIENKINTIIKDGTLEYRKLLERSENICSLVFGQKFGKGV